MAVIVFQVIDSPISIGLGINLLKTVAPRSPLACFGSSIAIKPELKSVEMDIAN